MNLQLWKTQLQHRLCSITKFLIKMKMMISLIYAVSIAIIIIYIIKLYLQYYYIWIQDYLLNKLSKLNQTIENHVYILLIQPSLYILNILI